MSGWEDDLVDPFVADLEAEDLEVFLESFAGEERAPGGLPDELKVALLREATLEGRFDHHVERVAHLMDIDAAAAKTMLDSIDQVPWHSEGAPPGVSLVDLVGGPKVEAAITGFVRLPAAVSFPEHDHLGDEYALVLQGSAVDQNGEIWRTGDLVHKTTGSTHSFTARPGPDLVFLVVAHTGIAIGGQKFGPEDQGV